MFLDLSRAEKPNIPLKNIISRAEIVDAPTIVLDIRSTATTVVTTHGRIHNLISNSIIPMNSFQKKPNDTDSLGWCHLQMNEV